jgi:hypothetical protein
MANSGKMLSKKSPKKKNSGPNEPRDLFIDMQVTGLRSNEPVIYGRTCTIRSAADNCPGRPCEMRADWTAFDLSRACDRICVRTQTMHSNAHQELLLFTSCPFCSFDQDVMQGPVYYKTNKTSKMLRY